MAAAKAKTKKRTTAKTAVRRTSRNAASPKKAVKASARKRTTNPPEPTGTATERVDQYWRTPRFKKDRAWLEEHLGQQQLFKYNPSIVRVAKVGSKGWAIFIGKQMIGKPGTKADAERRLKLIKDSVERSKKRQKPASPKRAVRARGTKKNTATRRPSSFHVVAIQPGKFGVFLGKHPLRKDFKTKAAAEIYLNSLRDRKKNPATQKHLNEFRLAVLKLERKDAKIADVRAALKKAEAAGFTRNQAWPVVKSAWNHGSKQHPKRNPGVISLLAEVAVGTAAALDINDRLKQKPAAKSKAARGSAVVGNPKAKKRTAKKRVVRNSSQNAHTLSVLDRDGKPKTVYVVITSTGKRVAKFRSIRGAKGYATREGLKLEVNPARTIASPKRAAARPRKRNSAAAARRQYESFQGRESTRTLDVALPKTGVPKETWCIGKLYELRMQGYPNLDFSTARPARWLVSNKTGTKLYIAGGPIADRSPGLADGKRLPLGEVTHVVYETEKRHLGDGRGEPSLYIHKFGEEGGERPVLAVDNDGYGHFVGGSYEITPLGIVD